jgi:hypothetical protein
MAINAWIMGCFLCVFERAKRVTLFDVAFDGVLRRMWIAWLRGGWNPICVQLDTKQG